MVAGVIAERVVGHETSQNPTNGAGGGVSPGASAIDSGAPSGVCSVGEEVCSAASSEGKASVAWARRTISALPRDTPDAISFVWWVSPFASARSELLRRPFGALEANKMLWIISPWARAALFLSSNFTMYLLAPSAEKAPGALVRPDHLPKKDEVTRTS